MTASLAKEIGSYSLRGWADQPVPMPTRESAQIHSQTIKIVECLSKSDILGNAASLSNVIGSCSFRGLGGASSANAESRKRTSRRRSK